MAIGRNTPAIANGYRYSFEARERIIPKQLKTGKEGASIINQVSRANPALDKESCNKRNSPGQPTKHPKTSRAGASVPVFGDWNDLNPALADGYRDEGLVDGYRYLSNHPSVDRESCNKPNEDINSTHPRNSSGHPNKQPKQGRCFSCLFG